MTLPSGSRLGGYEITAPLGAGGMGEVYRARDPKLSRDVAIKVLPPAFAEDRDRVARFRREAQVLASLNHPAIAAIYGLEESGGTVALVLELVEGEDLAERLARGPIPIDEAIAIARQIADGLDAAHEKGIVHRDLKPANARVTKDGAVKILDFGLAKALEGDTGASDDGLSRSPTMSRHMTEGGMILGTAAYMSPEQARGRPVDRRSDIWSFGVVLYEMLAGRRLFSGETVSDTLAAVLRQEVDLAALPAETPAAVRRLLSRCLERDPRLRLRDIADARFDLSTAEPVAVASRPRTAGSGIPRASVATFAAVAIVAIVSVALSAWLFRTRPAPAPRTHLSIALPDGHSLDSGPAISRDGRRVAFVSSDGVDRPGLRVRALDEEESRPLAGTDEASSPFFSPDGEWISFYARNQLYKVRVDGGAPVPLAPSTSHAGGTWTDAGTIVFKKSWNGPLYVVGENGGEAKVLLDLSPNEYAHTWPCAVPGGRELVFDAWGKRFDAVVLDLKTMKRRAAVNGWWRRVAFVPPDWLVGGGRADGELLAARLPAPGGAAGSAATVQKGVDLGGLDGASRFDVSWNGTLVYVRAFAGGRRLVTVNRRGEVTRLPVTEGVEVQAARASRDGQRAVVVRDDRLVVVDLARGTATPLLPELDGRDGAQGSPVWSPDGRSVTFSSNHDGSWNVYSKPASGAGEIVPVLRQPGDPNSQSYAPDGTLLFATTGPATGMDLWILPPGGTARAWLATAAEEQDPRFSPDGRTVAYASNASGRFEVYVQDRENPLDRVQLSAAGGRAPAWSPKGDRVFFRQGNLVMEAAIRTTGGLFVTPPVRLFDAGWTLAPLGPFEVMPDGERFLMVERPRAAVPTRLEVVEGWIETLKEKMPAL